MAVRAPQQMSFGSADAHVTLPSPFLGGHSPLSARTAALQRKVTTAKAERLTCSEAFCSKCLPVLCCALPTLGLAGCATVPPRHTYAVFRFGKLDAVIDRPGLTWIYPFSDIVKCFTGARTQMLDSMNVIDAAGNPIIVRALLEYAIEDPAALRIAVNDDLRVLINMAEQTVREACTRLPLIGEKGADIRSQMHELAAHMESEVAPDAAVLGVVVTRLCILEARYAPEIAAQMLMKQQAQATVAARREIVAGAMNIVRDVLKEMPQMTEASRDRIVSSLLVTLTSHSAPIPTLNVGSS